MIKNNGNEEPYINCDECGKPITHIDKYGEWCEDECRREEAKEIWKGLDKSLYEFGKKLGLDFPELLGEIEDIDKEDKTEGDEK